MIEETGLGFKLLRDTIASYATLSEAEKPQGVDAVIQTWIRQQSKVAGLNLATYYKGWGWPVAAATESALAALPAYPKAIAACSDIWPATELRGGNLATLTKVAGVGACCDLCSARADCQGWTHNALTGTCTLKKARWVARVLHSHHVLHCCVSVAPQQSPLPPSSVTAFCLCLPLAFAEAGSKLAPALLSFLAMSRVAPPLAACPSSLWRGATPQPCPAFPPCERAAAAPHLAAPPCKRRALTVEPCPCLSCTDLWLGLPWLAAAGRPGRLG